MLYLDSSALIKRYLFEKGTDQLNLRIQASLTSGFPVLTSVLSYAEIHAALARQLKDNLMRVTDFHGASTRFESDWRIYLSRVALSQPVLAFIPALVKKHPLKAGDAVQLASALWANAAFQTGSTLSEMSLRPVLATSDRQLKAAAEKEQFEVFDPEARD